MGALSTGWQSFGPAREYGGYFASLRCVTGALPGVLVLQEVGGVDDHIEDVTRRFARAGYAAFAPDLFSKNGVRPPELARARLSEILSFLSHLPPAARMDPKARDQAIDALGPEAAPRVRQTLTTIFGGSYLPIVRAAADFLRNEHPVTRGQKIFSLGFCMGGGLSAQLACHDPALAGAVVFYGRAPAAEDLQKIQCPVLGLYGRNDAPLVSALPAFSEAMKNAGKRFESVVYENAEHAFFNDTRPTYAVHAARGGFARALAFLAHETC